MRMRLVIPVTIAVWALMLSSASAAVTSAEVSTASPSGRTPQNHQNEPTVAIDQSRPDVVVSGWNDWIDQQVCPQASATDTGTCAPSIHGVGLSGVGFSFDGGRTWHQPTYTGWTNFDCVRTDIECTGHVGPIHTLPWYYENGLVSEGDPAVAWGPKPDAQGRFSWANGSRLYYANLVGTWNPTGDDVVFPGTVLHNLIGLGVSRADNVTAANFNNKSTWQPPVVINTHGGATAFEDKEQIWADNAASSPHFGAVYVCNAEFRSLGQHLPGTTPAPLKVYASMDGGTTWQVKQVTPAGSPGQQNPTEWGYSGCTIRTDSTGVVYLFAERFQNPAVVGLPTHGTLVMWKSFDGGKHWTKQDLLRRITDPCYFIDPVYGRCVMDGYAGARTDLSGAPSVDIANGAPTGADATDEIVLNYVDSPTLNNVVSRIQYSTDRGATWSAAQTVSLPGDRAMYTAPAISPDGRTAYVVYNADLDPWRGADMTSSRRYRGVFRQATVNGSGQLTGWTTVATGAIGDLRASYPGHDIYQERIGDYVYSSASRTYGVGVENDLRNAAVCPAVQQYRAASLAAGTLALPAPWPVRDCPATFGNLDIWAFTTR
jgi:hypothetical protein